jgi:predicted HicB family RNase H-like nuclease
MTSEHRRTPVDLEPLLAGLEQPLQLVGDSQLRDQLRAYISAARPQVERAAFDLLSQAVNAFNDANPDQRARLEYADGRIHVCTDPAPDAEPETSFNEGDLEKVTLRLPKELKDLIDTAAGRHGISANNWYVRELSRTIARSVRDSFRGDAGEDRRGGRRRGFYRGRGGSLHGFVGDQDE